MQLFRNILITEDVFKPSFSPGLSFIRAVNMAILIIYAIHFNHGNVPSPWASFYNSAVKCYNNHNLLLLEKPQKHVS